MPTLPQAIGPAENALRSLLERRLRGSGIDGYLEWVALNVAHGLEVRSGGSLLTLVTAQTKRPRDVAAAVADLRSRGLLDEAHRLTPEGRARLDTARARISETTGDLVRGIDTADLDTAVRVLETVRAHAEALLLGVNAPR